jgi:ABC-type dipeptide/oligopeptide/nickel transport system ATPase component
LLCKRPILVLDEWAADQDPQFRKEFYDIIIPRLRAMGKTVIAITHDDHYYSSADKVLSVSHGMLVEEAL